METLQSINQKIGLGGLHVCIIILHDANFFFLTIHSMNGLRGNLNMENNISWLEF